MCVFFIATNIEAQGEFIYVLNGCVYMLMYMLVCVCPSVHNLTDLTLKGLSSNSDVYKNHWVCKKYTS